MVGIHSGFILLTGTQLTIPNTHLKQILHSSKGWPSHYQHVTDLIFYLTEIEVNKKNSSEVGCGVPLLVRYPLYIEQPADLNHQGKPPKFHFFETEIQKNQKNSFHQH
jgi:hypothetical protein